MTAAYPTVRVADYIRVTLGMSLRSMGRPTADSISEMEADARALLGRIGVDPTPYFPAESVQVPSVPDETAGERHATVARLRALTASLPEWPKGWRYAARRTRGAPQRRGNTKR